MMLAYSPGRLVRHNLGDGESAPCFARTLREGKSAEPDSLNHTFPPKADLLKAEKRDKYLQSIHLNFNVNYFFLFLKIDY